MWSRVVTSSLMLNLSEEQNVWKVGQQQPFPSRHSLYSVAASEGPHFQARACSQDGMLWQSLCSVSLLFSASFKCANDCALGESEEMLLNLWEVRLTGRGWFPSSRHYPQSDDEKLKSILLYSSEVLFPLKCAYTLYLQTFFLQSFYFQVVILLHV